MLSELEKVANIDVGETITMVLTVAMRAEKGMAIGSPLAAGAAALCAAWREELALRMFSAGLRAMTKSHCFVKRWLDDLWVVRKRGLVGEIKEFLDLLQTEDFYGGDLRLQRVRDPEPFGFLIHITAEEGVVARSRLPFITVGRDAPGPGWQKLRSTMSGGPQFRSKKTEAAVAAGYLARYLDMSTEDERSLTLGLLRVVCELLAVGVEPKMVKRAVAKYAFGKLSFLRPLTGAVGWPEKKRREFCMLFDEADACLRSRVQCRMLQDEVGKLLGI